jgi:hypothetical protein
MKIVREHINKLFEIGEANVKSYEITYLGYINKYENRDIRGKHMIGYEFITEDNDNYLVTFLRVGDEILDDDKIYNVRVDFRVKEKPVSEIVNKGRIFKVLSTICEIIKDYIKKEPQTFSIWIFSGKNKSEKEIRYNLYTKYIESHLPKDWKIVVHDNIPEAISKYNESSHVIQLINDENYKKYDILKFWYNKKYDKRYN